MTKMDLGMTAMALLSGFTKTQTKLRSESQFVSNNIALLLSALPMEGDVELVIQ